MCASQNHRETEQREAAPLKQRILSTQHLRFFFFTHAFLSRVGEQNKTNKKKRQKVVIAWKEITQGCSTAAASANILPADSRDLDARRELSFVKQPPRAGALAQVSSAQSS